jgi:hypothetical protein
MLTTNKSRLNHLGKDACERARNQNARQSQATQNAPAAKIMCPRKLSAPERGTIVMAENPKMASKLINAQISGMINNALMVTMPNVKS